MVRTFEEQLRGIERALPLLRRTRSRDGQRVMLGCLLKDLEALRAQVSTAPHPFGERFAALEAKALLWRARLGAPVAPDEDPGPPSTPRKRRKEEPHDPPAGPARHPDPGDRTPTAPIVPQE